MATNLAHKAEVENGDVSFALVDSRSNPAWHSFANKVFDADSGDVTISQIMEGAKLSNWNVRLEDVVNQIAACNMPTSLQEIPGLRSFRVTPNPVRGGRAFAEFDLTGARRMRYEVYTTDGRQVFASASRQVTGRVKVPLEGLDRVGRGPAFLVFKVDNGGFTQRVVVE